MKLAGPKLDSKPISGAKWLLVSGFLVLKLLKPLKLKLRGKTRLSWFGSGSHSTLLPGIFFKLEVEARLFTKGVKEDAILKR